VRRSGAIPLPWVASFLTFLDKLSPTSPNSCQLRRFQPTPAKPVFMRVSQGIALKKKSDPNGIRTRVTAVKGRCPNRWTIGSGKTEIMAISTRIARADPPKERSGPGGRMRCGSTVDHLERHGHGVRADHAVAVHLRCAAGADVFDFGRGNDAQAGSEKARTRPDGPFEQWRFVSGGFDLARSANFACFENDRPSGDRSEEFFGQRQHGSD
jgi:hypothetical protein